MPFVQRLLTCLVLARSQDIEYIRSHYNIEDFIYFSHHQREEHAHLFHFAINPIFRHYTKFFLKEIFRLGHKTCLYYPIYPAPREGKVRGTVVRVALNSSGQTEFGPSTTVRVRGLNFWNNHNQYN